MNGGDGEELLREKLLALSTAINNVVSTIDFLGRLQRQRMEPDNSAVARPGGATDNPVNKVQE